MRKYLYMLICAAAVVSCDYLDTRYDSEITQDNIDNEYTRVIPMGYAAYGYMKNGLSEMDGNIAAAKSDEAAITSMSSDVRLFNNGAWSAYNNPDDPYEDCYKGIRAANYFRNWSVRYKSMLMKDRDIVSDGGTEYRRDVENAAWLRAESKVLIAWYYFELIKRYGDVPLYKDVPSGKEFLPRSPYQEVAQYAVDEIDSVRDSLAVNWNENSSYFGRFDLGAALALKSRILLYAASPLNTEGMTGSQTEERWTEAAKAAADVIALGRYRLADDYSTLFTGNTSSNPEIILSRMNSASNSLETSNYPIATPGGNSGITPSQNLVDAYEWTGPEDPDNPFANRDPRLTATIVTNGSTWNGRTIDISENGTDSYRTLNSSRTGYYLKKYLTDGLVLTQGQTAIHQWVYIRYAEILLNFAEAANEAWGPDQTDATAGMSARSALNMVRNRAGLEDVDLTDYSGTNDTERMRNAIKAERRVELAFEDHRYWDLLRWKDGDRLGDDIRGIRADDNGDGTFSYTEITVESRIFDESRMYRYPIPFTEISKSNGVLTQNQGW